MGGVVSGIFGGGGDAPPPPNYNKAAEKTAAANLQNAQAALAANRLNQDTVYGSLTYGKKYDDTGKLVDVVTQTMSPRERAVYEAQHGISMGALDAASRGLEGLDISGVDQSQLAQTGINPGENYTDAMMRQMNPQLERDQAALDQRLANQGIGIGSEAHKTAQSEQSDAANRARLQAVTGGMQTGLAANQQGFAQAAQNKQIPVSLINALRGGSQVQNSNYVNTPQMATTQGADYMGAAQAKGQYDMNTYNAQTASNNAMTSGLFSLGGDALMAPMGTFPAIGAALSEPFTKENIVKIGEIDNGLGVYEFDYKPEFKDYPGAGHGRFTGVMADEVQEIMPEAVVMHPSGIRMVNYSMIGV